MGLPGDATCMDIIIHLKLGDTCNDAKMYRWASEMTDFQMQLQMAANNHIHGNAVNLGRTSWLAAGMLRTD